MALRYNTLPDGTKNYDNRWYYKVNPLQVVSDSDATVATNGTYTYTTANYVRVDNWGNLIPDGDIMLDWNGYKIPKSILDGMLAEYRQEIDRLRMELQFYVRACKSYSVTEIQKPSPNVFENRRKFRLEGD